MSQKTILARCEDGRYYDPIKKSGHYFILTIRNVKFWLFRMRDDDIYIDEDIGYIRFNDYMTDIK